MLSASSPSKVYWQAKIWGILHDPVLKALHNNTGRGGNSFWQSLGIMQDWVENDWNPEEKQGKLFKQIKLADFIASAGDRGAIGSISSSVNYDDNGLTIKHLLSGATFNFKVSQHDTLISNRLDYLKGIENQLVNLIPEATCGDIKQVFWWLWRCLPQRVFEQFDDENLMLLPAETRFPDSSIWNHGSITAALAGALTGYDATEDDFKRWESGKQVSHPYVVSFTFTPVQELIKASRKMRDFWAGSWILHYISAKICFELAVKYGPDCFIYPSLFQQPLIDHWLRQKYPDLGVNQPSSRDLLTAGFPNVIVMILPKDKVEAAMQMAEQTLKAAWQNLGDLAFDELQNRHWMKDLDKDSKVWDDWLKAQWQFYWAGVPLGKEGEEFKNASILEVDEGKFKPWVDIQNQAFNANRFYSESGKVELDFLRQAYQQRLDRYGKKFSINVGSWWSSIFDQTRNGLATVKNARSWKIPTVFAPRSTISGIGAVVHPLARNNHDWVTEGETKKYWERHAGLFDGKEQLNATETVKRVLEKILPQLLSLDSELKEDDIAASYPDLTSGVAGYLKVMQESGKQEHLEYFDKTCQAIIDKYPWTKEVISGMRGKWGIPWMDDNQKPKKYHPRLLNARWLVEDAVTDELKELEENLKYQDNDRSQDFIRQDIHDIKINYRQGIQKIIDDFYPSSNPSDWYVLAAGDGDDMSQWLKGNKMLSYREYIPSKVLNFAENNQTFNNFLNLPKQMGPSTHSGLSRALLDFSNQLVPYLTEQRYAGRLTYSGGDDILASSNLWEWDSWLWDIRQCFCGQEDPHNEFDNQGDYWHLKSAKDCAKNKISQRPLFTMGREATISFGIVISHHSVPLAITLENMWEAEKEAKTHCSPNNSLDNDKKLKDAVQVRILYGNGNSLKATAKFDVFHKWQELMKIQDIEASIFEQAASLWEQHPIPIYDAISAWTKAFCERREQLKNNDHIKIDFQVKLFEFIQDLWSHTPEQDLLNQVQNWLKIAAFVKRNRTIKLGIKNDVLV